MKQSIVKSTGAKRAHEAGRGMSAGVAPTGLGGCWGVFPGLRFACPGLMNAVPPGRNAAGTAARVPNWVKVAAEERVS
jgi:hypothetical protein